MERSQWYVGVPNGVVLCVDYVTGGSEPGEGCIIRIVGR